jgi:hypothetical protein
MKNNNLIQEEINRAKQLWGYDTSKTIFEQFSGNTGTTTGNTGMITCYGCPGHMQPLETKQFQGPAGAPPYNPDPNMNWGNWCGWGQSSGGYISYWEDQSLVSAICNSGTTGTNTGTSNTCTSLVMTMCSGGTNNVHQNYCCTINGQPLTQNNVGTVVESQFQEKGTISSVNTIPNPGGYQSYFVNSVCPGTNTGTTNTGTTNTGTTNTGTTGTQYPGNYNPQTWWNTFLSNAQSKPWYATRKCNFFQNRINKWNTQLQSGVGPKQQNMLQNKIGQTSGEAVGEGCNFPGL